ncbi:ABC transporter substrate-binding protein [Buchananella hordeovulneris]|uniref:ABC transporter substrate-binding protein n=1 Tax=Buchananella hordeovulneris TaxID=52770 RepID=A0A1Q5PXM6_9ACTO|nr:ABC transporter substrate-binding protein [Buchananella hordeovulneris]MDO5081171.1 ABC transporter substrate-binding protein [Buchananella hordeovulneris]OKL52287.1 ABC transporter substrate-binding protein [Buchananella hordeovulneris]RRD45521.1 ABC transporter substrate-binding protein [Buchananella hordeovulneris]
MNRKPRLFALISAAALALAACGSTDEGAAASPDGDVRFDVSTVKKVDEIAALLPPEIAEAGVLKIASATDYAPAEFRAEDGQTPVGYDIELIKAIGNVLGVKAEVTHAQFDSIIPAVGTKFDASISSFTITDERIKVVNMIEYIEVGSAYAVQKGNPKGFDPANPCGKRIAVQTGTYQDEALEKLSAEKCSSSPIEIVKYDAQSEATTNLVGGALDSFYADSQVVGYAITLTDNQLEQVGEVEDSAPQGIIVSQQNPELTKALAAALQHLMDDGTWTKILEAWGSADAALPKATVRSAQ